MAKGQEKGQSFLRGAAILTASTMIVKILGLVFSMFLGNFINAGSMSYFYAAYQIFAVFLMLSTAGLPVAVSRMVSTSLSQGRRTEAERVFSVAARLFFCIGIFGSTAMFFGARQIAGLMRNPGAAPAIMALAPTMFFISIMSALRGYFQGRSNMAPTAVSQTIEAVTKVIIGVGLAVFLLRRYASHDYAVVGAISGVSASAFLGMLYLLWQKVKSDRRDRLEDGGEEVSATARELLVTLLKFAIPITLGSCFLSVLDTVGDAILMDRLQFAAGFSEEAAKDMYGVLGHARKFFDLPGGFVIPISTSLLPVLSGAIASRDREAIDRISLMSLRVTFLISIPASVGMALFSRPICGLLLAGNPEAAAGTAPLLSALSAAIAFNCALYTTNAILQSFGRPLIPVVNMALGGIVKIVLSYVLNGMPSVNVMGSAISTVVSYGFIMVLNFIAIRKLLPGLMKELWRAAAAMLGAAVVMGTVSYGFYWLLCRFLPSRVAVLPAILAAVVVYAVCVVAGKVVTKEEVLLLPKGEKIAKLLRM